MIHIFPAQFVGQSTKIQARRLTFEVDDANKELSKEIGNSSMGTNFLIFAYDMSDLGEIENLKNDKEGAKNLLMKQLHAKLGDYSVITGVKMETIKNVLRLRLQHRGSIVKSMSELDEMGLARAIFLLDTELNPGRFNYSDYAKDEQQDNTQ